MTVESSLSSFAKTAPVAAASSGARRRWMHLGLALWLASGVVMCAGLPVSPVARTQEARVLETAREMLGGGADNWLVPKVNGNFRLQKPPLAYWLTAFSYKIFGVGEGAGRLPAALAGWLTVGVTGLTASFLFGRRAGFFAAAALCGSYLFFRHSRLAETDVLAMLFVTTAIYALWRAYGLVLPTPSERAVDDPASSGPPVAPPTRFQSILWFHVAAAAMGLAVIAKGPPAAYPLIFLVALTGFDRRWRVLWSFVISGAPLNLALIALPWFLYVRQHPMAEQLANDLRNSAEGGRGHSGLFTTYIPPLFVGTAPWSVLMLIALIAAIRSWRRDPRLRGMVIWVAAILIPLSFWGNKQFHYLMPLMPPLMVLVGWLIDESLKQGAIGGVTKVVFAVTTAILALGAPALIVAAKIDRGYIVAADFAVVTFMVAALAAVWFVYRARGTAAAMTAFAVGTVAVLFVVVGLWAPSLNAVNCRTIAPQLEARFGSGPYAFVGKEDLPLVFHMRRIIPVARSQEQIAALAGREPPVVVIEPISGTNRPRPMIEEQMRFEADKTTYRIGRVTIDSARTASDTSASTLPGFRSSP
jgi:4-amino-4-deoxy-L-arabinose transferase-like glycosyltransferase